ncbi:hypothetical protein FH5_04285 [Priestia endophytica]|nr:hypothetical protein FH5_04285 [Priestia endophytica]
MAFGSISPFLFSTEKSYFDIKIGVKHYSKNVSHQLLLKINFLN